MTNIKNYLIFTHILWIATFQREWRTRNGRRICNGSIGRVHIKLNVLVEHNATILTENMDSN